METILENKAIIATKGKYANYILPLAVCILSIWLLKDYCVPEIQIILGILVSPFVFKIQKDTFSYRYAYASLFFLIAFYFLHIYVFLFFSLGCLAFFTIESQFGKIGILPFLFLICVSPTTHYLVNLSTFSIRLELSHYSAVILNSVGLAVENKGSYFVMPDGSTFSVDSACIGLNMFNTGLLVTILLIGFAEQRTKKALGFFSITFLFSSTIACLILTNLLRIVAIVFFKSEPDTIHHDMIGIASLIIYTIVPVYFIVSFLNKKFGTIEYLGKSTKNKSFKKNVLITVGLSLALFFISNNVKDYLKNTIKDQKLYELQLPGYSKKIKELGVAEFRKDSVLIYIKPASRGYEGDHQPVMCWQGSGFKLEKIMEANFENFTILTAILKKDTIVQYTAWWYDNGTNKTISQWDWRFSTGEPYRIINITTKSKEELNELCRFYLKQKLF